MRRARTVLFFLVVVLMASMAGAMNAENADGHDWRSWTVGERYAYVLGFLAANGAASERLMYEGADNYEALDDVFFFEYTVEEIASTVTAFYASPETRGERIIDVIYALAGKDYWNG